MTELGEVIADAGRRALVDHLAARQENGAVEEREDLGARLVDRAHDRLVQIRQLLQQADHGVGRGGVQTACGLVQERDLGVGHELGADGRALLLAAGDALDELVAHHGVGALGQTQRLEHVRQQLRQLRVVDVVEAQPGGELHDLARRGGREEGVLLHHVAEQVRVLVRLDRVAIQGHAASHLRAAARCHAAGQDVHEGRLPGAGRTQDARELAGPQVAGDPAEDGLLARLRAHGVGQVGPGQ
mmetsp:Transcript_74586/g.192464  ORF Transcript_74586/g.192464 Transcript_74586/m.192464 type:complete len:243 (+) Transcript_74586:1179-1907(+)